MTYTLDNPIRHALPESDIKPPVVMFGRETRLSEMRLPVHDAAKPVSGVNEAMIHNDGSISFERTQHTDRPAQIPDATPARPQILLDHFERDLRQNPRRIELRQPDGTATVADEKGNSLTTYPDGRKTYVEHFDGMTIAYDVNPRDGSATETVIDPAFRAKYVTKFNRDGSQTQTIDNPDFHIETVFGSGGKFQRKTSTDLKTGKIIETTLGPDGKPVVKELRDI